MAKTINNNRKDMANAIRALSIDAIDKAKSGHPGMPLGMSDIAQVLWNDYFKHNPKTQTGSIVIDLFSQMVMAQCCYTAYCI